MAGTVQGNCVSGRFNFERDRMYALGTKKTQLDVSTYDFTIDYGAENVQPALTGIDLNLLKSNNQGIGLIVSSTRYIQYAKITVKMSAVPEKGVITTFGTVSPRKDEIQWNFVGSNCSSLQTNVYYKGIPEYTIRSRYHTIPYFSDLNLYELDWTSQKISWSVNGNLLRSYQRNESLTQSYLTPAGEQSYPSEPSQIKFSVWDAGSSPDPNTSKWAGGPINWGVRDKLSAHLEYIEIQCYDNNDKPVDKWPIEGNMDRASIFTTQKLGDDIPNKGIPGSTPIPREFKDTTTISSKSAGRKHVGWALIILIVLYWV